MAERRINWSTTAWNIFASAKPSLKSLISLTRSRNRCSKWLAFVLVSTYAAVLRYVYDVFSILVYFAPLSTVE